MGKRILIISYYFAPQNAIGAVRPTARHAWASTRPVSLVALMETAMVRLETSSSISRIPPFREKSTSGQSVQKCRYRSSCSFLAIFR